MPEQSKGRRASGGHVNRAPVADAQAAIDWSVPTDAATLRTRVLPTPDQSRYGTLTKDPLGRDGPGWHISEQTRLPTISQGWERDPQNGVPDADKVPGLLRRKVIKQEDDAW